MYVGSLRGKPKYCAGLAKEGKADAAVSMKFEVTVTARYESNGKCRFERK